MLFGPKQVYADVVGIMEDLRPHIQRIIDQDGSVWEGGPSGVWVCVLHPSFNMVNAFYGIVPEEWPSYWDPFGAFAVVKAALSMAEHLPSEECTLTPLLKSDELPYRNWKGGIYIPEVQLAIGSSALTEDADTLVSETAGQPITELLRLYA